MVILISLSFYALSLPDDFRGYLSQEALLLPITLPTCKYSSPGLPGQPMLSSVKAVLILYYSHLIPVFTRLWASRGGPGRSESTPHVHAQLLSQVWLCDAMDCSPPGSSVHGVLQVRILEWVAMPFSRGSSQLKDQTQVSCIGGEFFTVWASREAPVPHVGGTT